MLIGHTHERDQVGYCSRARVAATIQESHAHETAEVRCGLRSRIDHGMGDTVYLADGTGV